MVRGVLGGASQPVFITGSDVPEDNPIQVEIVSSPDTESDVYDPTTNHIIVIDHAHHEVHEGHSFVAGHYNASVAHNASLNLLISTTSKIPHLVFRGAAGGDSVLVFSEGVSVVSDGTVVPVQNMNRNSGEVSSVLVYHTPNTPVATTTLETMFLPGGTGPAQSGGDEVRRGTEWNLLTNTKYMISVTNISGSNQPISINVEFYTV